MSESSSTKLPPCSGHHVVSELEDLVEQLRGLPELNAKRAISLAASHCEDFGELTLEQRYQQPGDDCAAFPAGDGYRLLAMEGMLPAFVAADPRAAGWSSVMVNVSDIAAMGGRADAIVNAFWHHDQAQSAELLFHIKRACDAFGVRFAGGHSSIQPGFQPGLAVAITGHAKRLLSCHHLQPGQRLYLLTDLQGSWHGDHAYWGVIGGKPVETIRQLWRLPAELAEAELTVAAKDISNGGILGTLIMMLELTGCGADVDLDAIPGPNPQQPGSAQQGDNLLRWLRAFQSFGFLLAVNPAQAQQLEQKIAHTSFPNTSLHCQAIGSINNSGVIKLGYHGCSTEFWNLNQESLTAMGEPHAGD